jgi:predicted 2-oxoglutarate/Fe(II)-dependent dioxygenase YbiX
MDPSFSTPVKSTGKTKSISTKLSLSDTWLATTSHIEQIDLSSTYGDTAGGKFCCIIDGIMSKKECEDWIETSNQEGYEAALLNDQKVEEVRNNLRCIIDDQDVADTLYERVFSAIKHHMPDLKTEEAPYFMNDEGGKKSAIRINERFRFLKYNPGTYFKPHFDGSYTTADRSQKSLVTCQFYLNEGFEGGTTNILAHSDASDHIVDVVPRTGRVLVFDHNILHESALLVKGVKYSMRNEIMYVERD